ncbi:PREDICTED: melanoma-associated antigen B10-like [Elephantulus edwardii]|uniref:melanoma-associated antigen B10-like n=1 Tax=Elephantulus edwardii TaxID=28737 RepID=UPI0003F0CD28|nr:PREDICTED: melanoma-associated antigen B10-like [Elephantulus edwardii]
MPRGRKSKLRAREKRRQARYEKQNSRGAEDIAAEEEGWSSSSSSFSLFADSPPTSPLPEAEIASSISAASASASWRGSDEGATMQDEARPSTSQASATSDRSRRTPLDQKAIMLVQFMLRKYNMKEIITKEDMLKYVIQKHRDHFDEVLKRASELLVLAFGIDVMEVDPINHCYALISKFKFTPDRSQSGEEVMPKTGLLMTVLCVIFMRGNCATEEDIWEVLNVMGIYADQEHFIYGEPRKLITEDFVQENYLEYRQVHGSNPPRYNVLWGPRAHAETSKMKVLEFLAKIHDTVPSAFPSWYDEALREEEERARMRFAALARTNAHPNISGDRE